MIGVSSLVSTNTVYCQSTGLEAIIGQKSHILENFYQAKKKNMCVFTVTC